MSTHELYRVVVVDDEILIRQGIKHFFDWEKEGFQIVGEASNGKEALEIIEHTRPHIVITDIVMPIIDGEELTRTIKSQYPNIEVIILSSFGEYDYVRSTFQSGVVDYILKPKLDASVLLKVLNRAVERIPLDQRTESKTDATLSLTHLLDKLISGYDQEYDSEVITKAFPYENYILFVINLKDSNESSTAIVKKIESAFMEHMIESKYYSIKADSNLIMYLLNTNQVDTMNVIGIGQELLETNPSVRVVISNSFSDVTKTGVVYKEEIGKLLQYQFYLPEKSIIQLKDLPSDERTIEGFNLDRFTDDLTHNRMDAAFDYLKEYSKRFSEIYTTDIMEYKTFFGNIVFNITILLGNLEYDVKKLETAKYTYLHSIEEATSAIAIIEQLDEFLTLVYECVKAKLEQGGNSNIKMLLEYIQEHYSEPLTLKGVANHFHFNPSYLSSYFANHNNEGFIDYLNKIRIEESAKLLRIGSTPISEISSMVGYSDHSYYCKVFKKIKGVSPSQYRRKILG